MILYFKNTIFSHEFTNVFIQIIGDKIQYLNFQALELFNFLIKPIFAQIILMYKQLLRPIFFSFDPEKIHHFTFSLVKFTSKIPGV